MPPLVTLTTDFEERDPFVASVKGVLCTRCPGVQIVDLSHQMPRQGVREAAFFLMGAVPCFPKGTVHLVAVASGARPIAVSVCDQTVVCPDNGVTTLLAEERGVTEARAIADAARDESAGGQIYFARDVFAPAAAFLASGGAMSELGDRVESVASLNLPRPQRKNTGLIEGQIIHINRFGSFVTNIHRSILDGINVKKVVVGDFTVGPLSRAYLDVDQGKPLALFGSSGHLEIAYSGDRADKRLQLGLGIVVSVSVEPARA